jgi:hypothetical protein
VDALLAAERDARDRIAAAEQARAAAADDRALAVAELAAVLGPTEAARRLGVTLTVVQSARNRAKLVRALRAAGQA